MEMRDDCDVRSRKRLRETYADVLSKRGRLGLNFDYSDVAHGISDPSFREARRSDNSDTVPAQKLDEQDLPEVPAAGVTSRRHNVSPYSLPACAPVQQAASCPGGRLFAGVQSSCAKVSMGFSPSDLSSLKISELQHHLFLLELLQRALLTDLRHAAREHEGRRTQLDAGYGIASKAYPACASIGYNRPSVPVPEAQHPGEHVAIQYSLSSGPPRQHSWPHMQQEVAWQGLSSATMPPPPPRPPRAPWPQPHQTTLQQQLPQAQAQYSIYTRQATAGSEGGPACSTLARGVH